MEIIFQALSSPIRLSILKLLAEGSSCVGYISERLDVPQTCVSQHLRVLRLAGIVESNKHGRFIHYGLNKSAVEIIACFFEDIRDDYQRNRHQCCRKTKPKGGDDASSQDG